MRYILAAALLASSSIAQEPFQTGDALRDTVKAECADGCLVLNREAAERLQMTVQMFAAQAYAAGKAEGSAGCRL